MKVPGNILITLSCSSSGSIKYQMKPYHYSNFFHTIYETSTLKSATKTALAFNAIKPEQNHVTGIVSK